METSNKTVTQQTDTLLVGRCSYCPKDFNCNHPIKKLLSGDEELSFFTHIAPWGKFSSQFIAQQFHKAHFKRTLLYIYHFFFIKISYFFCIVSFPPPPFCQLKLQGKFFSEIQSTFCNKLYPIFIRSFITSLRVINRKFLAS